MLSSLRRDQRRTRPSRSGIHVCDLGFAGMAGCHGGVATGFFVDTSGGSPIHHFKQVGKGSHPAAETVRWEHRSTREPASNLALVIAHLGNGNDAPPTLSGQRYDRPVSSECPAYGASLNGFGEKTLGQAERAPLGDSDSLGRAEVYSLGFFLGLDRRWPGSHSLAHRHRNQRG